MRIFKTIILILFYVLDYLGLRYLYSADYDILFWGLLAAIVVATIMQVGKHFSSKRLNARKVEYILDNQTGRQTDKVFRSIDYPGFAVLCSEGNSTTYCDSTGSMINTVTVAGTAGKTTPVLLRTGYLVFMFFLSVFILVFYLCTANGLSIGLDRLQDSAPGADTSLTAASEPTEDTRSAASLTSSPTLANGDSDPEEFYLQLDSRRITEDELSGYSQVQLQYIINSLYAMHGRVFHTPEFNEYFSAKEWYSPRNISDEAIVAEMSDIMTENLNTLITYRNRQSWNN